MGYATDGRAGFGGAQSSRERSAPSPIRRSPRGLLDCLGSGDHPAYRFSPVQRRRRKERRPGSTQRFERLEIGNAKGVRLASSYIATEGGDHSRKEGRAARPFTVLLALVTILQRGEVGFHGGGHRPGATGRPAAFRRAPGVASASAGGEKEGGEDNDGKERTKHWAFYSRRGATQGEGVRATNQ